MVHDYIGIVGAVKDVLSERVKAWQSWQAVQVGPLESIGLVFYPLIKEKSIKILTFKSINPNLNFSQYICWLEKKGFWEKISL